ncbi:MAG: NAD-dependent epimerase/dehydratase family protein, partial [Planctomycetia bacterium]
RRVVHASTESILGCRRPGPEPLETAVLHEEDMIGPYCRSKHRAEVEALRLGRAGAPVVVVNPTLPVGPGDRLLTPPSRLTLSAAKGELPAYLECEFNMIDVRDVATGMRAALDRGQPGRRYILGAWNLRLSQWLALTAAAANRPAPTWKVPYPLALTVAFAQEAWADWITGRAPQATLTGVRLTRRRMHFDAGPSLAALGLTPRPITESLSDAVAWYRQVGWLK